MKYFISILKEANKLNSASEVHVFYLKNLLCHLNLSYDTWLYFCVLLGDFDIEIERNIKYFKQKRIDTRYSNFMNLITYLKQNESSMLSNSFSEIRNSYSYGLIKKIDDLLALFKFENKSYKFIDLILIDDFDRFIISTKDLKICYLSCLVEDCNEQSIYHICQDMEILQEIYTNLSDSTITEYSRLPLNSGKLVKSINYNPSKRNNNLALNLLLELNDKNLEKNDDLSLLHVSLAIWYDWLTKHKYNHETSNVSAEMFLDSVIYNWIILMCKSDDKKNQSGDLKKLLDQDLNEML